MSFCTNIFKLPKVSSFKVQNQDELEAQAKEYQKLCANKISLAFTDDSDSEQDLECSSPVQTWKLFKKER